MGRWGCELLQHTDIPVEDRQVQSKTFRTALDDLRVPLEHILASRGGELAFTEERRKSNAKAYEMKRSKHGHEEIHGDKRTKNFSKSLCAQQIA